MLISNPDLCVPESYFLTLIFTFNGESIMKKIATVISAASLAVVSASVSAWGWGDNGYNNGSGNGFGDGAFDGDFGFNMNFSGRGNGRGYGNGYNGYNGNNGYGYAPYGHAPYGAPVGPAVLTEEQQKAIADQQAKYIEDMQNAQKQAAEFYANRPAPAYGVQPAMYGNDFMKKMEEEHAARVKEMEARMEESRKAAEKRHQEAQERFEARRKDRAAKVEVKTEDKAGA
jgi:hypothetical protein